MTYDATKSALNKQAMAAANLLRELASDDDELNHDAVEGETDFFEAVQAALDEIDECEVLANGLDAKIAQLQTRFARITSRAETIRGLIEQAFAVAEIKSHVFPNATITQKSIAPRLIVSDESQIPSKFYKPQPPKLDRKALLAAVKEGPVDGVELSNGGQTIQIRRN